MKSSCALIAALAKVHRVMEATATEIEMLSEGYPGQSLAVELEQRSLTVLIEYNRVLGQIAHHVGEARHA